MNNLSRAQRQTPGRRGYGMEKSEPAWVRIPRGWKWTLGVVSTVRGAVSVKVVQYFAALVFALSSAGIVMAIALLAVFLLAVGGVLPEDLGHEGNPVEVAVVLSGLLWLLISALIGLIRGRREANRLLATIRFMGLPARESLKAWDRMFLGFDRAVARVFAAPLLWILKKPHRIFVVAALLFFGAVAFFAGVLIPGKIIAWSNQYGSGLKRVGGLGLGGMAVIIVLLLIASILFGMFLMYVWLRSVLVAIPSVLLLIFYNSNEFPELNNYAEPLVKLVSYLPSKLAQAYEVGTESALGSVFFGLAKLFIGAPGLPTTIGMLLTGLLFGWLPHLIEQLGKPTPRELVNLYGWDATQKHYAQVNAYQEFKKALWGFGLVIVLIIPFPVFYISGEMGEGAPALFFLVIGPVLTAIVILSRIIKGVLENGQVRRPHDLVADIPGLPAKTVLPNDAVGVIQAFPPLPRLLSEAQRHQSLNQ